MNTSPSRRKAWNERAHGASVRRAATTQAATATTSPRSSGLVVREAAAARPSAHSHHAPGCSARGSRLCANAAEALIARRASATTPRRPDRPPGRIRRGRRRADRRERRSRCWPTRPPARSAASAERVAVADERLWRGLIGADRAGGVGGVRGDRPGSRSPSVPALVGVAKVGLARTRRGRGRGGRLRCGGSRRSGRRGGSRRVGRSHPRAALGAGVAVDPAHQPAGCPHGRPPRARSQRLQTGEGGRPGRAVGHDAAGRCLARRLGVGGPEVHHHRDSDAAGDGLGAAADAVERRGRPRLGAARAGHP